MNNKKVPGSIIKSVSRPNVNIDTLLYGKKNGKKRNFSIEEYGISINYTGSPYIGFDVWSEEEDVDLFYQIEQRYQTDEFYESYTTASK